MRIYFSGHCVNVEWTIQDRVENGDSLMPFAWREVIPPIPIIWWALDQMVPSRVCTHLMSRVYQKRSDKSTMRVQRQQRPWPGFPTSISLDSFHKEETSLLFPTCRMRALTGGVEISIKSAWCASEYGLCFLYVFFRPAPCGTTWCSPELSLFGLTCLWNERRGVWYEMEAPSRLT